MKPDITSGGFIEQCRHLYQQMLADMEHCRNNKLNIIKEIECCFQMAEQYWVLARYDLSKHRFDTVAQEIEFFKEVKPLFIAEADYYSLLYHAELFRRDVTDPIQLERFWQRELLRLKRFEQEQQDFVGYWRSGRTDQDQFYFVRQLKGKSCPEKALADDLEKQQATSHDHLISTMKALERYNQYIENVRHPDI